MMRMVCRFVSTSLRLKYLRSLPTLVKRDKALLCSVSSVKTSPPHAYNSTCWRHRGLLIMAGLFGLLWKRGDTDEESDDQLKDSGNPKVPPSIKKVIFRAEKALANVNYTKAEEYFHDALRLLETNKHATSHAFIEARAVVMDKLGNMYLEIGDWKKGASNLTMVISLLRICGVEEESSSIVELSLKIAKAYANLKWQDKAEIGFEWCLKTAKTIVDKERTNESIALLGMCHHAQGQYYVMVGRPERAYKSYTQAVECARAVYGTQDTQVAVIMNDCASALDGMGDFKQAVELINGALEIIEQARESGDYNENMAVFLMNLAAVQNNQGLTEKAAETYASSFQFASKTQNKRLMEEIKYHIKILRKI